MTGVRGRPCLAVASLLFLLAGTAEGGWTRVAWEETDVLSVVCPPDSCDVIYVTVYSGELPSEQIGVHKSTDAGQTWRYLPESNNVDCNILSIDPKDQAIVYCGSHSYWSGAWPKRSRDAGEHWEDIEKLVDRIVPSPWRENRLLATQTFDLSYSLEGSTDDGATWEGICGAEVSYMSDNVIFHREDSLQVFAGFYPPYPQPYGLGRSTDGGSTWQVALEGEVSALDQDPANGSHWAAVIASGTSGSGTAYFAQSLDDGVAWESWELPDDIWYVKQLAFDPFDAQTIYLADPRIPYGGHLGVYRTTDSGTTWTPMNEGFSDSTGVHCVIPLERRPGELLAAAAGGLWRWAGQQSAPAMENVPRGSVLLAGPTPCPFNDTVRARLHLRGAGRIGTSVYSLQGALVRRLFDKALGPGDHTLVWDGRDAKGREVPPAGYIMLVRTESERKAVRMIKIR